MFVNAGFVHQPLNNNLLYQIGDKYISIDYDYYGEALHMFVKSFEKSIDFNDRKSIEFYYNKFREILEFEVAND